MSYLSEHLLQSQPPKEPVDLQIEYNADGDIQRVVEVFGNGRVRESDYAYDDTGNIIEAVIVFNGLRRTETYSYNEEGQVSSVTAIEELI